MNLRNLYKVQNDKDLNEREFTPINLNFQNYLKIYTNLNFHGGDSDGDSDSKVSWCL